MPGMAFLDSLPCVGLFLQCILPGFISQEPTMLEHSLEGFPLLRITMCILHACCLLLVCISCMCLLVGDRGGFMLVCVFMQLAHICMYGATVRVLRCLYACV